VRNVDDTWPEVFYDLGFVKSKYAKKMLDFLAWLSYAFPAAITPISEGYKRLIVDKYGIPQGKVHVIEVGVEGIKPVSVDKNSKDQFVVMYSGNLGLGYDFDVVFEAARLLDKNDDIIFIIRGVGEMAQSLKMAISERGLRNVVLNTSFLPKDELSTLLGSADVFVLPMATLVFIDQGLPTKVFEYQAYGKPIICVSGGVTARYVESTESGLVIEPGDANGFAEAVTRLYSDRQLCVELGLNGREYVKEHMTSEKIGAHMYNILSSVVPLKNN
jgi:glycosyltransferase involved in cell wall biosynthesis